MKLPRDIAGAELAKLLSRYGYEITRQTGGHIRLRSAARGTDHHVTIPAHRNLRVGTLNSIVTDIATYLKMSKDDLTESLFGK